MTEIVKETVTSVGSTDTKPEASNTQMVEYFTYFTFGVLEVLLVFRLILKLMGANPSSSFVNIIYTSTGIFNLPFEGIFRKATTQGIETTSVLEPATIVAIIVYGVVAWGIITLVRISSGKVQPKE